MTRFLIDQLADKLAASGALLAQAPARLINEAGIAAAIVLTVTGMAMSWHLPRHRMSMEERVKDGKLTEAEAERRLRFYGWCAPVATLLGVGVLLVVLFELGR